MTKQQSNGCREYNELSRRQFLSSATVFGGVLATAPAWLPQVAMASSYSSTRDVVISVYLRGGIDGLNCVIPFTDPYYYTHRPVIAIADPSSSNPNRAINLDGTFGFAPAMQPLMEPYQDGKLLIVHGVGATGWSRSHFDAQRWMEVCDPGNSHLTTGWLGRHLATTGAMVPGSVLRGASLTYGMVRTLNGGPLSLAIPDPGNYGLGGDWPNESEMRSWLDARYDATTEPLRTTANNTQATMDLLESIDFANYVPAGGAVYPDTNFGRAMKSAAALIRANVGVEALHIDIDGWDTHFNQGSLDGSMRDLMTDLAQGMAAIYKDLNGANRPDYTLIALSEFGRTVRENESEGTDHGTATATFVMGGSVIGNRVMRHNWQSLHPDNLWDGVDVPPTIDFRDLLSEILFKRAENTSLSQVFPSYTPNFRGIFA